MPPKHKKSLLELGVNTKADQIEQLQEMLKQKFGPDQDLIADQKDFTVLHYLYMIESEGPSQSISESINQVLQLEEFQHLFIPPQDRDSIDEELLDDVKQEQVEEQEQEQEQAKEQEDDEDDPSDVDYEDPSFGNEDHSVNTIDLRSRSVTRNIDEGFSPAPSSSDRDEIMTHADVNLTRFRELGEAAMRGEAKEDTMAHYFALMRSLEAFVERYDLETADDG
ncbi:hypothetical protein BG015_001695 [Linnemannia schmuckeri]|uniref:Uncharacterized protein n=1 Tax=Linnemannia schmuckeri TaxID=64567 RepID=A0A9P5V6T7_9FUNG|nr:hypothetical protein BG015_001695 [Linnemannia schmuckeri]